MLTPPHLAHRHLALVAIRVLYPHVTPADAANVVLPHPDGDRQPAPTIAALHDEEAR
jgi:hypothetical protein